MKSKSIGWLVKGAAVGAIVALVTSAAAQTTIYSTFVPQERGYVSGGSPHAAAWSQTDTFGNVTVAVGIDGGGGTNSGTVYLTTRLGPGTTVADEVAQGSYSVSGPQFQTQSVTLFSGLTLGPGTYYLTVVGTGWEEGSSFITPEMAPGVQTVTRDRLGTLPIAAYPPAGNFQPEFVPPPGFPPPSYWKYSVISVPEPTPAVLFMFVAAIWAVRRCPFRVKDISVIHPG